MIVSTTPMPMPPASASGNDCILPTMPAVSALRSRVGPRELPAALACSLDSGPKSTADSADSTPARTHTWVETFLTEMPASDAALGLSAAARTLSPNLVLREQEREDRAHDRHDDQHRELIAADVDGPTLHGLSNRMISGYGRRRATVLGARAAGSRGR